MPANKTCDGHQYSTAFTVPKKATFCEYFAADDGKSVEIRLVGSHSLQNKRFVVCIVAVRWRLSVGKKLSCTAIVQFDELEVTCVVTRSKHWGRAEKFGADMKG